MKSNTCQLASRALNTDREKNPECYSKYWGAIKQ